MHSSGTLTISLSAVQENFKLCQSKVGADVLVAPAVKANGYGLGIDHIAPALQKAGAKRFFVATIEEGITLRKICPAAEIGVLNGIVPGLGNDFFTHNLIPVINDEKQAKNLHTISKQNGSKIKSIVHIDTGMNRLGLRPEYAKLFFETLSDLDGLEVEAIISHFTSADEIDNPFCEKQYAQFEKVISHRPAHTKCSLANSAGIFRDQKYHYDMVRPGMCIYGLNPAPHTDNPMHQVVNLSVPVLQIHTALKGEAAGYGESYIFDQDSVLATVSLGYADGFLRSHSNVAHLYWNDTPCPILGRVSMDTVIIDVTHIPDGARPEAGDQIEVIGRNQSADDLADASGTIGYEILTSLGSRYKRIYVD